MTFFVCCEWQLKQENHSTLYFLLHPKSLSYYNQGEVAHVQPTANDKISKIAGLLIVLLLLPCFESFNFKNLIYILDAKSLILVQINVLKYMTRILSLTLLYFSASLYFHGCVSHIICYFWFLTLEKLQKRLLREKTLWYQQYHKRRRLVFD